MKKYLYLLVIFIAISTNLFAGGAGVLPMTIDPNGDVVFLLGKEKRYSKVKVLNRGLILVENKTKEKHLTKQPAVNSQKKQVMRVFQTLTNSI